MNQILSVAEINAQFDAEWILLEDPQFNEARQVQGGRVICHSKDRDEVDRKLIELRPKRFATLYTGKLPKDAAIVL